MSYDVLHTRRHRRPRMTRKTRHATLLLRPWRWRRLALWLARRGLRVYSSGWAVRLMVGRWLVSLDRESDDNVRS